MRKRKASHLLLALLVLLLAGCKKFLDEKPSKSLAVPSTLADVQALLDYYPKMNNVDPGAPEISSGDYYLTDADYNSLAENFRRMYTWEGANLFAPILNDWSQTFDPVYTANTALEVLAAFPRTTVNEAEWNNVKGQAYFYRGRAFLVAAGIWCKAWNPATVTTTLGLPLRLSTNFNQPSVRSSLEETYRQIITDLKAAAALLPVTPVHKMRPSRPAAFGLLARACLWMREYGEAGRYADSCLQFYNKLIDYNTLSPSPAYPFKQFNDEDIFHSRIPAPAPINNSRAKIDSLLYQSYAQADLRKTLYFRTTANASVAFRGSYEGNAALYSGIAVDEIYLIRAEALARQGKTSEALTDLNTLLSKRWKTGTFVPFTASDSAEALALILQERRKELLMRGLRWMDIKRLNEEGAGISLSRRLNSQLITLSPGDPRFALPIPEDVIALSGMQQNPK